MYRNNLPIPIKIVENFLAFSTGFRKPFLFWIDRVKLPEQKLQEENNYLMTPVNKNRV